MIRSALANAAKQIIRKQCFQVRRCMHNQTRNIHNSCPGCGAAFQSDSPAKAGHLPTILARPTATDIEIELLMKKEVLTPKEAKLILNTRNPKVKVCYRCHQLKTQSRETIPLNLKSNKSKFNALKGSSAGLIILVIDATDIPGTLSKQIRDTVGDKKTIVVLNKIDLLPEEFNVKSAVAWIKKEHPEALDVIPASAVSGEGIFKLAKWFGSANSILKTKVKNGESKSSSPNFSIGDSDDEDIYLVGATNVGKSRLVNALRELTGSGKKDLITTSDIAGTTIGMIKTPYLQLSSLFSLEDTSKLVQGDPRTYNRKIDIYDTPGIYNPSQMHLLLSPQELNEVVPKKKIKLKEIVLLPNNTIFLSELVRIDCAGPKTVLKFYGSSRINLRSCETTLAESPYRRRNSDTLGDRISEAVRIIGNKRSNGTCYLSGVGWFIFDRDAELIVHSPSGKAYFYYRTGS